MRRKIMIALAMLTVLFAGCGNSNASYESTVETAKATADYFSVDSVNESIEESSSDYYQNTDRKLIKTVNISTETDSYDEFIVNITKAISDLGGYSEEFSQYGQTTYRYANITARIPKQNLEVFLQTVEGKSNITSHSERIEDITLQYVDIQSHKTALETEQKRLLELLEKAESVSDIIAIEDKLANVRYQLDSMESQLRTYDNKIDFTTVYLNIEEVYHFTPSEEIGTWEKIKIGFSENIYEIGIGIENAFVWFVIHIPNIIITIIIIVVVILIIRKISKKRKNR